MIGRATLVCACLVGCGDDGSNQLPDAPLGSDAAVDASPDAMVVLGMDTNVPAAIGNLCAIGYDPVATELLGYPCSGLTISRYSTAGAPLGDIMRPGESADDVDLDVLSVPAMLGTTALPAGTALFINGETDVAEIYALTVTTDPVLVTMFGASHVVGGAYHNNRSTVFAVQDRNGGATLGNLIAELDPVTGAVLGSFQTTPAFVVNFGDLDVCQSTGNLFVVSNVEATMAEFTPTGQLVAAYPLPAGIAPLTGIAIEDGTGAAWASSLSGNLIRITGLPCP